MRYNDGRQGRPALLCSLCLAGTLSLAPAAWAAEPGPTPEVRWAALHRGKSVHEQYPEPWAGGPAFGSSYPNPLPLSGLQPLQVELKGQPMYIVDNPEAYQTPGLLGSTIAPVTGRGDGTFDFRGAGRLFVLAQNRIVAASERQWLSAVVHNPTDHEVELRVRGILFAPKVTPVSGDVPAAYLQGVFSGTHAVVSSSFMDFSAGINGAFTRQLRIPARQTRVLAESPHLRTTEIFLLVDLASDSPSDLFRLAVVASLQPLGPAELQSIAVGSYPAAGRDEDYAYAGPKRYGRPNGVCADGQLYQGGRTIDLKPGTSEGDLVFATRFRNVGTPTDLPGLAPVLPNPPAIGPAASTDDGSYGMSYRLRYLLNNPTRGELHVTAALTSPRSPEDADLAPLGGIMTLPVRFNGKRFNLRVDARGGGTVIGSYVIPAGAARLVDVEFTHFGNTYPPAALEFRTERPALTDAGPD